MSKCNCPFHTDRESHLDALALVWLLGIGDRAGYETILSTYLTDSEGVAKILFALSHVALDCLMSVSVTTGASPDEVLAGARDWVVNHDG